MPVKKSAVQVSSGGTIHLHGERITERQAHTLGLTLLRASVQARVAKMKLVAGISIQEQRDCYATSLIVGRILDTVSCLALEVQDEQILAACLQDNLMDEIGAIL